MTKDSMIKTGIVVGIIAGVTLFGLQYLVQCGREVQQRMESDAAEGHEQRIRLTRAKMRTIENAIGRFYMACDRYIDDSEGLEVLLSPTPPKGVDGSNWSGPYLEKSDLRDLWDRPFVYVAEGEINPGSYDLISLGPDGKKGGGRDNDDIYNE